MQCRLTSVVVKKEDIGVYYYKTRILLIIPITHNDKCKDLTDFIPNDGLEKCHDNAFGK